MCAKWRVRLYHPCGHSVYPANHSETIHDTQASTTVSASMSTVSIRVASAAFSHLTTSASPSPTIRTRSRHGSLRLPTFQLTTLIVESPLQPCRGRLVSRRPVRRIGVICRVAMATSGGVCPGNGC